jgi:peptidoglycan hydrolase CwlO-like protein
MGFREKLTLMRREYRVEAAKLDDKVERLALKMDAGLSSIQERLGRAKNRLGAAEKTIVEAQKALQVVSLQLQGSRDEMAATHEAVGQLRGDLQETARTMTGRSRLLEDRFGKMLDLVGSSLEDSQTHLKSQLEQVFQRLERLERKNPPAA